MREIGVDRVFRYNFDLWRDYSVLIDDEGFAIRDLIGREARLKDVAKLLWRKPLSRLQLSGHRPRDQRPGAFNRWVAAALKRPTRAEELYVEEEMFNALAEIKNLLWRRGRVVLIEPASYTRLGKLVQLDIARQYFQVPAYEFVYGRGSGDRQRGQQRVVKSLTSRPLRKNTFLWTTVVDPRELDTGTPWLVQDLVAASHDVTCVFVRGEIFAYKLARDAFVKQTVDWREVGELTTPLWKPHALAPALAQAIVAFMDEADLHFGRLDFLLEGDTYWFLEVNSNGEWEWLDRDGTQGVLRRIVSEVHPDTPVHPIPIEAGAPSARRARTV